MNEWDAIKFMAMDEQKQLEIKMEKLRKQLKNNITTEEYQKKKAELDDLIALSIIMSRQ